MCCVFRDEQARTCQRPDDEMVDSLHQSPDPNFRDDQGSAIHRASSCNRVCAKALRADLSATHGWVEKTQSGAAMKAADRDGE